ncbi:hypothetical protein MBLNU230_g1234t1 [Neophaeotheca triangularis]
MDIQAQQEARAQRKEAIINVILHLNQQGVFRQNEFIVYQTLMNHGASSEWARAIVMLLQTGIESRGEWTQAFYQIDVQAGLSKAQASDLSSIKPNQVKINSPTVLT